jgi:hypothetical protein
MKPWQPAYFKILVLIGAGCWLAGLPGIALADVHTLFAEAINRIHQ